MSPTVAAKPCHFRLSRSHWCSVRLLRALAADTFILTHEAPETRGTWEGRGVLGYYLGPHLPITALITTSLSLQRPPHPLPTLSHGFATPTASMPAPPMEPRVVQQPVINQPSVQEIRVVETPHAVKEPRVVFPTLAIANPR